MGTIRNLQAWTPADLRTITPTGHPPVREVPPDTRAETTNAPPRENNVPNHPCLEAAGGESARPPVAMREGHATVRSLDSHCSDRRKGLPKHQLEYNKWLVLRCIR